MLHIRHTLVGCHCHLQGCGSLSKNINISTHTTELGFQAALHAQVHLFMPLKTERRQKKVDGHTRAHTKWTKTSLRAYSGNTSILTNMLNILVLLLEQWKLWISHQLSYVNSTRELQCGPLIKPPLSQFLSYITVYWSKSSKRFFSTLWLVSLFPVHHHTFSGQADIKHMLLSIMRLKHSPDLCPLGNVCRIQAVEENRL